MSIGGHTKMKTIYQTIYKCDVCGQEFDDWKVCSKHGEVRKEKHATGLRLAKEINEAIKAANERGGVEIGVYCNDPRAYRSVKAEYDPSTGQVNLEIDSDDRLQNIPQGAPAETEGSNNGK
jgi:hypothetical protein